MADALPPPVRQVQEQPSPRWPWILGGLVGGFFLLAAGLGLGWYLFYRPIACRRPVAGAPAPPRRPVPMPRR